MAVSAEAGELLAAFQWLNGEDSRHVMADAERRNRVVAELADVMIYLLRPADVLGVDVQEAAERKIKANLRCFPVEQVRGRALRGRDMGTI